MCAAVVISQSMGHVCACSCTSAASHALQHQEALKHVTGLNLCFTKRNMQQVCFGLALVCLGQAGGGGGG